MHRGSVLVLALSLLLPATGCASCNEDALTEGDDAGAAVTGLTPEQAARVVAKVGNRAITLGDVAATLDRMDEFDRLRYQTKERRRELLQEMIDVELLAMEAERRGLDKETETQEAIRQILRDALLAEAKRSAPAPAEISADQVKKYYEDNIDKYREPERRRVSVISMRDETAAKEVLEEARGATEDKRWGELFREHHEGPKDPDAPLDLAGDLGLVGPPGDEKGENPAVPEAIRAAVFAIEQVGGVHPEVVAAGGRFNIVRLSGRTQAHQRTLAEADRSIRVAIIQGVMEKLEAELEAKLKKEIKVEIDDKALAALPLPSGLGSASPGGGYPYAPPSAGLPLPGPSSPAPPPPKAPAADGGP